MDVAIEKITDIDRVERRWAQLEPRCRTNPFNSWGWIGPWLKRAVLKGEVWLIEAVDNGDIQGLGLITHRRVSKRRLLPVGQIYLNENGPEVLDFCIEYNGFLVLPSKESTVLPAVVDRLSDWSRSWDEFHIRRVNRESLLLALPQSVLKSARLELLTIDTTSSPFVDLAAIRNSGAGYLEALSANRRSQIRRGLRRLESYGAVKVSIPASVDDAQEFFSGLKRLHQEYWIRKGMPGSFASETWEAFHREIIAGQFISGGVQLLRIAAGDYLLGYIYSLVKNGSVYMIQTGLNYSDEALRPGELSHVLAIEWNLAQGNLAYDFLGGEARYKTSLATSANILDTVVFRKRQLKFVVEDGLRRALRYLRTKRALHASPTTAGS